MWVLKYEYTLEDGKVNRVSCCLRESVTYTIGRSSKCNFITKNDKSISRQHLSVKWKEHEIAIQNFGKVTQVDSRQLNDKEVISFSSITHKLVEKDNTIEFSTYEVHMGTTPVIVELLWISENWIIPCTVPNQLHILKDYGINLVKERDLTTNIGRNVDAFLDLQDNESYKPYRDLFLFSNNVRTLTEDTINDLLKLIDNDVINFDDEWQNRIGHSLLEGRNKLNTADEKLKSTIKGIYFCTIGCLDKVQLTYTSLTFSALGVTHVNIDTTEKLNEFTNEHRDNDLHLILIRGSEFKDESDNYILKSDYLISTDEVKKYLLKMTLKNGTHTISELRNLLHKDMRINIQQQEEIGNDINKKKLEASSRKKNIVEDNPMPIKRRRIARPKVKPLNSLSFFVGGGDAMEKSRNNNIEEKKTSIKSMEDVDIIPIDNVQPINESCGNDDKFTQIKENHIRNILTNLDKDEVQINRTPKKNVSTTYETAIETIPESGNSSNRKNKSTDEEPEDITDLTEQISPTDHKDTNNVDEDVPDIGSYELNINKNENKGGKVVFERPKTLVDVIRSTKSKAIERLKTDIVEIRPEELTDSAINDFANLEIDVNPSLIVQRDRSTVEQTRGLWHGRKNFKKFVKVYPSSRKNNDSITNTALLITRSYIDTKPFDKTSKWKTNNGFDVGEDINGNSHYEGNDSFGVESRPDEMITSEPVIDTVKESAPDKRRTFIHDNDNSSDEEPNSFSFSKFNNNTNGLFVTNEDDENGEGDIDDIGIVNGVQIPSSNVKQTDIERTSFSKRNNNNTKKDSRMPSYKTPTKTSNTYKSKLANSITLDSDDSDDSDDGPNFKFRRNA